jgi:hypothetical protein
MPRASRQGSLACHGKDERQAHGLQCRLGDTAGRESVHEMRWRHLRMDQAPASYLKETSTFTR